MRSRPEHVDEQAIVQAAADGWGLDLQTLEYVPEGGGAYHWSAPTADGRRWFVTCDDLDTKPWFGPDRESVGNGLLAAYRAAMALRAGGLPFVAAPIPTISGAPAIRIDDRHTVALFEHVNGEPGRWGRPISRPMRTELIRILAELHTVVPAPGTAPANLARRGLDLPDRATLEDALDHLHERWDGGPMSEPVRHELRRHRPTIVEWLEELDRFAAGAAPDTHVVVTHGEPHPGNLIHTPTGIVLVDWDTVALARPERDLWMLADAPETELRAYQDVTGTTLDPLALHAYRRLWALADLASFTVLLRGQHRRHTDTERSLVALRQILAGTEPAPYGQ